MPVHFAAACSNQFSAIGRLRAMRMPLNAEAAFFAGNREEYRWWMAICTSLDRRMSAAVAFRASGRSKGD